MIALAVLETTPAELKGDHETQTFSENDNYEDI